MTQTVIAQVRCSLEKKDIRVTGLKRKERDMTEEKGVKRVLKSLPVRSRINADTDLWKQITFLKRDCRMSGVIPSLEPNFKKRDTLSAYLCSPTTDQLSTGLMDLGWGCGYRNCQMLMSFLNSEIQDEEPIIKNVLDINSIQLIIEKAWKEGFDSLGAAQLENNVFKTRKWIGTTEVYTLLTFLGIRSTIIDFHQPGPEKLHKDMFDWIQYYFTSNNNNNNNTETNSHVIITNKPPLYLQHQGHSRTVIGIELLKSGKRNLIMFDPGKRMLRLSYNSLSRPYRVDDKSIARNKQYSLLVLGQVNYQNGKMIWNSDKNYLLNEEERDNMKNVTSLTP